LLFCFGTIAPKNFVSRAEVGGLADELEDVRVDGVLLAEGYAHILNFPERRYVSGKDDKASLAEMPTLRHQQVATKAR